MSPAPSVGCSAIPTGAAGVSVGCHGARRAAHWRRAAAPTPAGGRGQASTCEKPPPCLSMRSKAAAMAASQWVGQLGRNLGACCQPMQEGWEALGNALPAGIQARARRVSAQGLQRRGLNPSRFRRACARDERGESGDPEECEEGRELRHRVMRRRVPDLHVPKAGVEPGSCRCCGGARATAAASPRARRLHHTPWVGWGRGPAAAEMLATVFGAGGRSAGRDPSGD